MLQDVMRTLVATVFLSVTLWAQSAPQPGAQYSNYSLILVPQQGVGFMLGMDKQQQIVFIPIPSVKKAMDEDGVSPIRYGDLLQLVRQLGEENQRLKGENEHLWKVAEGHGSPTSILVQQQQSASPAPDPDADRRATRMVILQSLLAPRPTPQTINLHVMDCTRYPALCVGK
jgi:hypothetical protein